MSLFKFLKLRQSRDKVSKCEESSVLPLAELGYQKLEERRVLNASFTYDALTSLLTLDAFSNDSPITIDQGTVNVNGTAEDAYIFTLDAGETWSQVGTGIAAADFEIVGGNELRIGTDIFALGVGSALDANVVIDGTFGAGLTDQIELTQVDPASQIQFGTLSMSNIRNIGTSLELNVVGDVTLSNIVAIENPIAPFAGSADILVTTDGSINVTGLINNSYEDVGAEISLIANGSDNDVTIGAAVSTSEGGIVIEASDEVEFLAMGSLTSSDTGNISVTANSDGIDSVGTDGIIMDDQSFIDAGSGVLAMVSTGSGGGDIEISSVTTTNLTSSAIQIQSGNGVTDGGDLSIDIVGGAVSLNAVNGIGDGNALETTLTSLSATNTTSNGIEISETDDVALGTVDNGTGDVNLTAGGAITDGNAGVVNVVGGTVALNAVNGIGDGDALETTLTSLSATNTTSNGIEISETDDVALETVDNVTGDVSLMAGGAITDGNAGGVNVVGGTVVLNAVNGIGDGDALETTLTSLSAENTTSNGIEISETDDVALDTVDNGTGDVSLAAGGAITDGGDGRIDIVGGTVVLNAVNGIGDGDALETTLTSLSATNTTSNGIEISETDDVALETVDNVTGDVSLAAGGAITDGGDGSIDIVGGAVSLTAVNGIGDGNALETTLTSLSAENTTSNGIEISETDDVALDTVDNGTGDVSLAAGGAITDGGDGRIDIVGGTVVLNAVNGIGDGNALETTLTSLSATNTTSNGIEISETDDVALDTVDNGARDVSLAAGGAITDGGDGSIDIVGGAVSLTAVNGIGDGNALETTLTSLSAENTTSNGIEISETDDVALDTVDNGARDVSLAAGGAITDGGDGRIDIVGGTVVLNAVNGIGDGNALETTLTSLSATNTTSNGIEISETDDVALDTVDNGARDVSLAAGGAITDGGDGSIDIVGGAVSLTAVNGIGDGNALETTLTSLSAENTTSNGIEISETDDVALDTVDNGTGDVSLAAGGAITDGGDGSVDIVGGAVIIDAVNGVGDGNALEIQVDSIDVDNTASGNIELIEEAAGGDIEVFHLDNDAAAGEISLVAEDGSITVVAAGTGVEAVNGTVKLEAQSVGNDVTINNAITTAGGAVDIDAGRDVTSNAAGDITTTGDAADEAGGTVDIDSGRHVNLAGDIDTRGNAADGLGGTVTIDSVDGDVTVAAIDASGAGVGAGGNIFLNANDADNTNGTATGDVTSNGVVQTNNNGTVTFEADDSVFINANITAGGTGDVLVTANADIATDANNTDGSTESITMAGGTSIDGGSGSITLTNDDDDGLGNEDNGGDITAQTLTTTASAGTGITVNSDDDALLEGTVTTGGANIDIDADANILTTGSINSNGGNVDLLVGNDVTINNAITTAGGAVDIDAGRDVTSNAAGDITTTGDAADEAGGTVDIDSGRHVNLAGDIDTRGNAADGLGGTVTIDSVDGDVTVAAIDASGAGVGAGGNIFLNANDADNTNGTATGDVTSNGVVQTNNNGTVTFEADDSVFINANITAGGTGDVLVTANADIATDANNTDGSTESITMAGGTSIDGGSGSITLTNDDDDGLGNEDNGGDITAQTLTTTASAGTGITVNSDDDALLEGTVTTGGANIDIDADANILTTGSINSNGGNVDLLVGNDVTINNAITTAGGAVDIDAGRDVTSNAAGDITTTGDAADEAGGTVDIDSGRHVNLAGDIDTRGNAADGLGGTVTIDSVDGDVTVAAIDASGAGVGAGGNIFLNANDADNTNGTATGDVTSNGVVQTNNNGTVTFEADDSVFINANITAGGTGDVLVTANADIATDANNTDGSTESITMAGGTSIDGGSGSITLTNDDDDGLGNEDNGGDITAQTLTTTASAGTGITVNSDDDALLEGTVTTGGANIDIDADANILTTGSINSNGGNVDLLVGNDVTINNAITTAGGTVDIDAVDDVEVNSAISTGGGAVDIQAADDVRFSASGTITTSGGTVDVRADFDNDNNGLITMSDGSLVDADNGAIVFEADENITLGSLLTSGSVDITTRGSVVDGGDVNVDIDGGAVTIDAVNGVGDGNALEIQVDSIDVDNTASGNIELIEEAAGGDIEVLHLDNDAAAGEISLVAEDGSITVVAAGTGVEAVNGTVKLEARGSGGNVSINNSVVTGGGVILDAQGGSLDDGFGAGVTGTIIATGDGVFKAANSITLTNHANDTLRIGGNASFEAETVLIGQDAQLAGAGGASATNTQFGSFTINSNQAIVTEDDSTEFANTSSVANDLSLESGGDVTNVADASIVVVGHSQFHASGNVVYLGNMTGDHVELAEVGVVAANVYLGLDGDDPLTPGVNEAGTTNLDSRPATLVAGSLGTVPSFGTEVSGTMFIDADGGITSTGADGLNVANLGIDSEKFVHLNKVASTNSLLSIKAGGNSELLDVDAIAQLDSLGADNISGSEALLGDQAVSFIHEGNLIIGTVATAATPVEGVSTLMGIESTDGSIFVSAVDSMTINQDITALDSGTDEAQVNLFVSRLDATAMNISLNATISVTDDINTGVVNQTQTTSTLSPANAAVAAGEGTNFIIRQFAFEQSAEILYGNLGEEGYRVGFIWDAANLGFDVNMDGIISPEEIDKLAENANLFKNPVGGNSEAFVDFVFIDFSDANLPVTDVIIVQGGEEGVTPAIFQKNANYSPAEVLERTTPVVLTTVVVRNDQNINLFAGNLGNDLNQTLETFEAQFEAFSPILLPLTFEIEIEDVEFEVTEDVTLETTSFVGTTEIEFSSTLPDEGVNSLCYVMVKVTADDIEEVAGELKLTDPSKELDAVDGKEITEVNNSNDDDDAEVEEGDIESIIEVIERDPKAEAGYWYKVFLKTNGESRLLFYHLKTGDVPQSDEAPSPDFLDENGGSDGGVSEGNGTKNLFDGPSTSLGEISLPQLQSLQDAGLLSGELSQQEAGELPLAEDSQAMGDTTHGLTAGSLLLASIAAKKNRNQNQDKEMAEAVAVISEEQGFGGLARLKRKLARALGQ